MALVCFGTVAPAVASPAGRRLGRPAAPSTSVRVPSATKSVAAAATKEEKGLFEVIFGALYKEEQLLETDPILNKVQGKAAAAAAVPMMKAGKAAKKTAAAGDDGVGNGGSIFGGLFFKKG